MPRKHTLGFVSQDDYRLIAIVTSLKDYRFTFYLNQALGIDLVHYDDIAYARTGTVMCTYPWFYFHDHHLHTSYYLIGNKHIGGPMLATVKEADYFVLVKSPIDDDQIMQLVTGIRSIENVVTAFEVQIQTVKDINSVLDTNELHEMEQLTGA
ncbi:MAG: IPExxxVDY family protein [Bacteroidales bacterium]|jgi:hypothetical protein